VAGPIDAPQRAAEAPEDAALRRRPVRPGRPRLHLTAPHGWINDPHGLVFLDGRWHVFFQFQPDAPRWGRMHWGHATSTDLLHWEHQPVALAPGSAGPDSFGCWSGSLVVEDDRSATIFYTGAALQGRVRHQSICRATSIDGLRTWTKDPQDPLIAGAPRGIRRDLFRDPHVWRDADGWAMLVGAGSTAGAARVLLWRSDDGRAWRLVGPLLTAEGVAAEHPDAAALVDSPCWECPQLVRLEGADVLVVSVLERAPTVRPAHVVAFTGRIVGDRFEVGRVERLGMGPDFYAPSVATAPDGRRLLLGWIPEDPPPRGSRRTWAGCLTLPRQISVDAAGRVGITVAAELTRLTTPDTAVTSAVVTETQPWAWSSDGPGFEFRATLLPEAAALVRIDITDPEGDIVQVRLVPGERRISITRGGHVRFAGLSPHGEAVLPGDVQDAVDLRLVLDGSVLELVADDCITGTARLPDAGDDGRRITISALGGACRLEGIEVATFEEASSAGT
jgi:beta-fructofuranosidase